MLKSIQQFFQQNMAPPASDAPPAPSAAPAAGHHPVEVAACALLLELAYADDEFTDDEREHIEQVLAHHFALDAETIQQLMALADRERRSAVDLYQFTSLINAHYEEGQRMVLAEVMWRVVYADGQLQKHERYLMHKLSSLLQLRPGFLSEARQRAVEREATSDDAGA